MNTTQHNTTTRLAALINTEVKYPAVTISRSTFRVLLMDQRTIVLMDHVVEEFEGRYKTEQVIIKRDKDALKETEGADIYSNPIVLPEVVDRFFSSCDLMRRPELVGLKTHKDEGGEQEWYSLQSNGKYFHLTQRPIKPGTWW